MYELNEKSWKEIIYTENLTTFVPHRSSAFKRYEHILPSGQVLVDYLPQGLIVRKEYVDNFDFQNLRPLGRKLKDKAILKLQSSEAKWFILWYQELYSDNDVLISNQLRLVEEFIGKNCVQRLEFNS